ncbi:MAG: HPr(Ser) kinase/phosphatase [Deltaproteobacteria bacterium]|nr:HPr(Ser) kinase/phosphatase [Deltaproteobacteria bacterium]
MRSDHEGFKCEISVEDLFEANRSKLDLEWIAGREGKRNPIRKPRIQKSSMALTGYTAHIDTAKIQIIGETEISYLFRLSPADRKENLLKFSQSPLPCCIVTKGLEIPEELVAVCEDRNIPLLLTPHFSSHCIQQVTSYLEKALARHLTRPGVLVDVYGVGILILGKSGIGKSECALDLIDRGHRLVADDAVTIWKNGPETLMGKSPEMTRRHMEIRGLGVINIKDLYGVSSIQHEKEIELVVELMEWAPGDNVERLGLDERAYRIMDVPKPFLQMPVRPGRNMALIIEVAARNHLLKSAGHFSARRFEERLMKRISRQHEETDA